MKEKTNTNRRLLLLLIIVLSIGVLLYCTLRLSIYSLSSYKDLKNTEKLEQMIGESSIILTEDMETGRPITKSTATVSNIEAVQTSSSAEKQVLDKYKDIYELNHDMIGWISIEGTKINYPVMQTIYDEEYYLRRNFYGEDSKNGVPFLDSRCIVSKPSTNLIIFGHNMKSGDMFADLLKYENKSYYENHKYIRFDTIYEEGIYEIIAIFRTRVAYIDENTFRFYNFIQSDSTEDFYNYYNTIRDLSLYETEASAISSDYLLTLATCEYSVEDGRFVVVARKIASYEKTEEE